MIDTPAGMFDTKVNREIVSAFSYIRNDCTDLKLNLVVGTLLSRRMKWAEHVARMGKRMGV